MGTVQRHDSFGAAKEDVWTTSNMEYGNFYISDNCCGWRINGSSAGLHHGHHKNQSPNGEEKHRGIHKMCLDCRREWDALRDELRRCKAQLEHHLATCTCSSSIHGPQFEMENVHPISAQDVDPPHQSAMVEEAATPAAATERIIPTQTSAHHSTIRTNASSLPSSGLQRSDKHHKVHDCQTRQTNGKHIKSNKKLKKTNFDIKK